MTLTEAILAIAVLGIAGTALLMGVAASVDVTDHNQEQMLAQGLAAQLLDELSTKAYHEPGGSPTGSLGPESGEVSGGSRQAFDDLDDYHGLVEQPPRDPWGMEIGRGSGQASERLAAFRTASGAYDRFRRETTVSYVSEAGFTPLPPGQTSNFRAVEVTVFVDEPGPKSRPLVTLRRVFAYVPSL